MSPWGLLAVALVGAAVARALAGYGPRDPGLALLARREAVFLAAAADAAFPAGGAIPPSGSEAGIVRHVDRWLGLLTRRNRVLIRLLFAFFEHATLLFPAPGWDGFRRFSRLRPEQRVALLEAWGTSRLRVRRLVFTSLRTLLTAGYFASPAVLRATGLAPLAFESPVVDADLLYPRIGLAADTISCRPEDRGRALSRAPLDPRGPLHPDYAEGRP
jgi:hypothetical protein